MIQHLACQMDGNRRWAVAQGLEKIQGHTKGIDTVKIVTQFCLDNKIPYLSLYTFSAENLNRSEHEKNHIFNLMIENFKEGSSLLQDCIRNGIKIRFIGDRQLIPYYLVPICDRVEQQTAHLSALQLNFMFCYGARQDIVHAVKAIAYQAARGQLSEQDIQHLSVDTFKNYLWTAAIPDPDLIIRAGAVVRLSNFMLYECAYSEWYFTDRMWPDMRQEDFQAALDNFAQRQRRFGK